MLNRLTVSALLKTVILVTSFCVVIGFSLNAWDAWGRLQTASRMAQIADASANMFKAMHNLRTDRSTTNRLLNGDAPMDADIEKYLRNIRDTEMPAMNNALGLLGGIEFAQQATLVPEFDQAVQDADRAAEGILGSDGQAEGGSPARARQGVHGDDRRDARDARQAVGRAGRRRQPPGPDDRPVAGDQADRLAVAQHRRRSLADRFERAWRRTRSRRKPWSPSPNSTAAPRPRGMPWS